MTHRGQSAATAKELEGGDPLAFLAQGRLVEPFLPDEEIQPGFHVPLATLLLFGKEAPLSEHVPFFETVIVTDQQTRRLRKNVVESVREISGGANSILNCTCPQVSHEAFQELLVNAYIHRCYRTAAPVVITIEGSQIEFQNPGELPAGLHVENLIHCVPVYRDLLMADGARFVGLCDKIGSGMDVVFKSVLEGGFDFPRFESVDNHFTATISFQRSAEFSEFVRRRSQSLSRIDEILALRLLWSRERAALPELSVIMQRGREIAHRILDDMSKKLMIEPVAGEDFSYRLTANVRRDIQSIFQCDQTGFWTSPQ